KARPHDRREEVVVEHKMPGVGPVVGDVARPHLHVGMVHAQGLRAGDAVKVVHPAIVVGQVGGPGGVADVGGDLIGGFSQRHDRAGRGAAGGGAVGAGEAAEVVVEGMVLLDDKDDVIDLVEAAWHGVAG